MARLRAQDMTQGVPVRPLGMTRDVVTAWDRHESELSDRCVSGLTTERPRITKPEKGPRKAMLVYFAEYARESRRRLLLTQAEAVSLGAHNWLLFESEFRSLHVFRVRFAANPLTP